jgi:cell cycle checkpoint protein
MGFDILEWHNPTNIASSAEGFVSASAQFEDFIVRGRKFGSLDLGPASKSQGENIRGGPLQGNSDDPTRQKILLVEEYPSTFTRSSTALQSFRSSIQQYLVTTVASLKPNIFSRTEATKPAIPLVLLVSETLLTTTTASADSFTAHRLLGPEILNHYGVNVMMFNPVAPTLLAKALELVTQKESRETGRKSIPGRAVWQKLGEVGDVRSAVSSLEFLCLKGDAPGNWGGKVLVGKAKKKDKELEVLTQMEKES